MPVLHRAATAVEQRRRQTESLGQIQHWSKLQRIVVVVIGIRL